MPGTLVCWGFLRFPPVSKSPSCAAATHWAPPLFAAWAVDPAPEPHEWCLQHTGGASWGVR
eukprot:13217524-Alexandrium_andersonii.AAC.1